jgi:hypothetical protein
MIFDKFKDKRYHLSLGSPLLVAINVDDERKTEYIDKVAKAAKKEFGFYKSLFNNISSALKRVQTIHNSVSDINSYLPQIKLLQVDTWVKDYIEDYGDVKPYIPNYTTNIKLPEDIDYPTIFKEYRAVGNLDIFNYLEKKDIADISRVYREYFRDNNTLVFNSLLNIEKLDDLEMALAISDVLSKIELPNTIGKLEDYRIFIAEAQKYLINILNSVVGKVNNFNLSKRLLFSTNVEKVIYLNPTLIEKFYNSNGTIEVIHGVNFSGEANTDIEAILEKLEEYKNIYDKKSNKFKLKMGLVEVETLTSAYQKEYLRATDLFNVESDLVQFKNFIKELTRYDLLDHEKVILDMYQTLIFPNSNIKEFVRVIDEHVSTAGITKARELALLNIIVKYLSTGITPANV